MYINNNYSYLNNLFLINLNKKYNKEIKDRLMIFVDFKLKEIDSTGLQLLKDSLNIINIKTKEINDAFLLKYKDEIISFFNPEWFKENKVEKLNKENVFKFIKFHERKGNIVILNSTIYYFFLYFSETKEKNLNIEKFYIDNKKYLLKKKSVLKMISLNNLEKEFLKELYDISLAFSIEKKIKLKAFFIKRTIMKDFSIEDKNIFLSFLEENNFEYKLIDNPDFSYYIKIDNHNFFLHEKFPFKMDGIADFHNSLKEAENEFNFLIS